MKLTIEEIEKLLKDRYRYFLELSREIQLLENGQMLAYDAQELYDYLSQLLNSRTPINPLEKKLYLVKLKSQCGLMAQNYMECLKCLKHPNKDIALISLYIFLQSILEILQCVEANSTMVFFEAEQFKTICNSLSRHLPVGYQYLQRGIKYKFNKAALGIEILFDMKHHLPDYHKYKTELNLLLEHPKIASLPEDKKYLLLQPLAEIDTEERDTMLQQESPPDPRDLTKHIIFQLTTMLRGYNYLVLIKEAVKNLRTELQDEAKKTQLKAATQEMLKVTQEKIADVIERSSAALLTLNSCHAKLPMKNHIDLLKDTEKCLEECQTLRENMNDEIVGVDSMEALSATHNKIDSQIQKMNDALVAIEQCIANHQSKIEEQKAEKRAWHERQQQLQLELAREIELKQLEEFKVAQAEKISKRKNELLAQKEARKVEKRSIFSPQQPTASTLPIGVNADMMERFMKMRDEHIDLILSILTLRGKIYYSDVENLILNQLGGDIIERGGSHKTITFGVLYTRMHVDREQMLPIKEAVSGGIARPHKPGHSVTPLSKLNTKLVRQALIAAGITIDAMEDIIARREQAIEVMQKREDLSTDRKLCGM